MSMVQEWRVVVGPAVHDYGPDEEMARQAFARCGAGQPPWIQDYGPGEAGARAGSALTQQFIARDGCEHGSTPYHTIRLESRLVGTWEPVP